MISRPEVSPDVWDRDRDRDRDSEIKASNPKTSDFGYPHWSKLRKKYF